MFERFVEEGGVGLSLERKTCLVYLRCVAEIEGVSRIVLELSWRQVRGETSSSACPTCEGWTPQGTAAKNILKPAQSRMAKRWMADNQAPGRCWPAASTDGCNDWKNKAWAHSMILLREGRRRPELLGLVAGSLEQSKPDFEK